MRHGAFLRYEPEKLATSLIKEARSKFQLDPWNSHLEEISGIKKEDITAVEKVGALRPLSIIQLKNREKTSSVSHNTLNNYQSKKPALTSIHNFTHSENESKLTKICRDKYKNTLRIQSSHTK